MTHSIPPFHLAVPVNDLDAARSFYGGLLGCPEGRSSEKWIDFDFFGHQFVTHLGTPLTDPDHNGVDGDNVPSFHYGAVLNWDDWHVLSEKLIKADVDFIIKPKIRFQGKVGEQATMFFRDPAGNAIEIKSFKDMSQLFAK
ncbi:glyoxalase/bleomycin resistance protein/dioxygenase superfamily protein [Kordiimonas sediminis]|uniref:Glyoxalase/bleomycin resistance protein/dioxygenase superfamily protein n=1 Tax=Kordiimonas sediminis TaxID=1735581 RepID=A0A919E6S8_9PROT|nr:VOC family protein [Kordiimonas sediminis]GHF18882.1 glyoxalase/bleomycin resistance protein/dioxygenase superfamily protein [Kordiimonas sediminis]